MNTVQIECRDIDVSQYISTRYQTNMILVSEMQQKNNRAQRHLTALRAT